MVSVLKRSGISLAGFSLLALMAARAEAAPAPEAAIVAPIAAVGEPRWGKIRSFEGEDIGVLWGKIRSFDGGNVSPFWGKIRSFWGDVGPFEGDTAGFWGNLRTYNDGSGANQVTPQWGKIRSFWDEVGLEWGKIRSFWDMIQTPEDHDALATQIDAVVDRSALFWGDAIEARTGKDFYAGFANEVMARHGIDPSDASSLAGLTPNQREHFFVDWYDGLMAYSGADHPDWWMKAVNWSPRLTQTAGGGAGSTIGLVDDYSATSVDVIARFKDLTKKSGSSGGHGEGVLSLIVAAHDGQGIMGIAPGADVVAYNPFTDGGTEWANVSTAIRQVAGKGATVINLSLGESGVALSPQWQAIFTTSEIETHKDKTLYIIAAGNDGVTQSGIVDMKGALDTTFIVVGSAGPTGISDFSNRPGMTCLTDGGTECKRSSLLKESGYLMNRFIVAPGELILVSDGAGGVVRQSGTSLAAPLVSGAVALIQDRWPWMKEKPRDIAMVILNSARDLGDPGIDPVYGVGMLDIEAAMSPLDFSKLKYYLVGKSGSQTEVAVNTLRSRGVQPGWVKNDMYFHAFEKLDQVERDFLIPLSSRLYGTTRQGEYFQDFLYDRMAGWIGGSGFASGRTVGIRSGSLFGGDVTDGWTMKMSGRVVREYAVQSGRRLKLRSTVHLEAPSGRFGIAIGHGDGAVAVGGQGNLTMASDFDPYAGGANPLLGFASGGTHIGVRVPIGSGIEVGGGFSEHRRGRGIDVYGIAQLDRPAVLGLSRYRSTAGNFRIDYRAANWLGLSAAITMLDEPNALLGVRSLARSDLAGGTATTGLTLGAHAELGSGLSLFGSATRSRSRSAGAESALRIGGGGIVGSSYQIGLARTALFGRADRLRLTVAQPLRVDHGAIELRSIQVVDRRTGEKGVVVQRYALGAGQPRRLVAEGLYSAPLLGENAELSLFGRAELRDLDEGTPRLMLGGQLRLAL